MSLIRLLVEVGEEVNLIILLFSFCVTDVAAARGGCFAGGTAILTIEGYKPIEQLDQSDRINKGIVLTVVVL